jgi:NAD(P)-dependent dehydrogenase (short-subunit alcohol dehydrogenase family)
MESIAKMRGRVIEAVGDIDILLQPPDDEIPYCSAKAGALAPMKGLSRTYAKEGLLMRSVCLRPSSTRR